MEAKGKTAILGSRVPLAEMFGYASEIRNITSGRAEFSMHFDRYEAVPIAIAEEKVSERRKATEGA